jgi:hypothetical protein
VASWILNFTKAGAKVKKQMPQQARQLLDVGLWGVPPTAQSKDKIAVGDRVLAYVGAPERVFIGDATVASGWHAWTPNEAATYPMSGTFGAGLALDNVSVWSKPVPLASVWPNTQGAKTNPKALWYGAVVGVAEADFALISAAGRDIPGAAPTAATSGLSAQTGSGAAVGPPLTAPPASAASAQSASGLEESSALFKAVAQLRKFLENPVPINEASTRAFFLDKYFDALGYSDFDDIKHGSVVQSGDFPDYVLRSQSEDVFAVEAKKLGSHFGPKEAAQLVKYCSVLGLRWGLLADGRTIQVYDAPVTGIPPEQRLVLDIDLNIGPIARISTYGSGRQ